MSKLVKSEFENLKDILETKIINMRKGKIYGNTGKIRNLKIDGKIRNQNLKNKVYTAKNIRLDLSNKTYIIN